MSSKTSNDKNRPAIRLRGLTKHYNLVPDGDGSLKGLVMGRVKGKGRDLLKVLDGLDLDIHRGEIVGICGANGAGKSTLLKIIAGIIPPTSGRVHVEGKVASLLELGAGFHPEMTGEENVLLNGAILGIPESELRGKMAAIFRTGGIERFAKVPIKHYSSGMVQRLGFAIASHLDPDILILDEVFAVGDVMFQYTARDLFEKFKAVGKTILLVSHDLSLLEKFCTRVVILSGGKIMMEGPPKIVTHQYSTLSWQNRFQRVGDASSNTLTNRMGDQRIRVEEVQLVDPAGEETRAFRQFTGMRIRMTLVNDDPDLSGPYLALRIQDNWGQTVCGNRLPPPESFESAPSRFTVELAFDPILLVPGFYNLEILVSTRVGWLLDTWKFAETFTVVAREEAEAFGDTSQCSFYHPAQWSVEGFDAFNTPGHPWEISDSESLEVSE